MLIYINKLYFESIPYCLSINGHIKNSWSLLLILEILILEKLLSMLFVHSLDKYQVCTFYEYLTKCAGQRWHVPGSVFLELIICEEVCNLLLQGLWHSFTCNLLVSFVDSLLLPSMNLIRIFTFFLNLGASSRVYYVLRFAQ